MADMPTDFWAGWVIALTSVSLLGLCWLVYSIYFSANREKQEQSPVWDETLSEGDNPAPMWWFWMTLAALVTTVVYLILYPGLGSFSGTLKWSSHGRLDHSFANYENKFLPVRKNILKRPISELQENNAIMESAQRVFVQNCAACHGMEGKGQALAFPNLKDDDWQWGGTEEAITQTLMYGRQAAMIGWLDIIGKEGVQQVKNYVKTLASESNVSAKDEGKQIYQSNCAACHGLLGEGNPALGAPNLSDDIWLYGSSDRALHETLAYGRKGIMPAFGERLDRTQIRMLTAWLMPSEVSKIHKESDITAAEIKIPKEASVKDSNEQATKTNDINDMGKQVYQQHCAACHQSNGAGLPGVFPPLKNSEVVLADDASEHIDIVLNGLKDKVISGVSYSAPMSGFSAVLNDEEIAAVINHERTEWGNNASVISPEAVATKR
ncbi:MAG: cytochrome-c oxidase, cbb3-type subunit III [Gammaproteobacteria bacterium]